ncbi:MAG: helicase-related protein [Asticcacaulis sp.]
MSDRSTGQVSRLAAVLGPTNTGKTHYAVERMLGHASGMIGLPLRLLAREVYDRIVRLRGARSVALITGEEKIVPPHATYFVCTVEAMPLSRQVDFLAVDEIQLCADPERGHVFTNRLLNARGRFETLFLGAMTLAPLFRRLFPDAEIVVRERMSSLAWAGSKKLTRLPKRSAVVAFSAESVYAIAELLRRQRGGAAVVMGSLSPRTRNAQVALFQSGEVDFLVATDAIGMGLNMDVDHVAFAGLRKFDGTRTRWLTPQEAGQIAGRAGRFRNDGTFGVTGDCEPMDEDLIAAIENHDYTPLEAAEWRSGVLDFTNLTELLRTLAQGPGRDGLRLAKEALDEKVLRALAEDDSIRHAVRDRQKLIRLWDVCQIPDFRKSTLDEHIKLVRVLFEALTRHDRRIPDDWIAPQFAVLDRLDGEIDALAARLSGIRTLAYVANRSDWLKNAAHWQSQTRALEDRLSDTLHERLVQRFVDRRTSVLMRALNVQSQTFAGISETGQVSLDGELIGELKGLQFTPATGETQLADRTLRAAARKALAPEIQKRLRQLTDDEAAQFTLLPEGTVLWRGDAAGQILASPLLSPRVKLLGDMGTDPAREKAARRLETFVGDQVRVHLYPLMTLNSALDDGKLKGLPRGIAFRLIEAGGVIDREEAAADLKALTLDERRALKALGVRIGAYSVFLPGLFTTESLTLRTVLARLALTSAAKTLSAPASAPMETIPDDSGPELLPQFAPRQDLPPVSKGLLGLRRVGPFWVGVETLEKLDALLQEGGFNKGQFTLPTDAAERLGWEPRALEDLLRLLGYTRGMRSEAGQPSFWRRRRAGEAAPVSDQGFAPREGRRDDRREGGPRMGRPDRNPERNPERSPERNAERGADRRPERASEPRSDRPAANKPAFARAEPAKVETREETIAASPFGALAALKFAPPPEPAAKTRKARDETKDKARDKAKDKSRDKTRDKSRKADAKSATAPVQADPSPYIWFDPKTDSAEPSETKARRKRKRNRNKPRPEGVTGATVTASADPYVWQDAQPMGPDAANAESAPKKARRRRRKPRGERTGERTASSADTVAHAAPAEGIPAETA